MEPSLGLNDRPGGSRLNWLNVESEPLKATGRKTGMPTVRVRGLAPAKAQVLMDGDEVVGGLTVSMLALTLSAVEYCGG